MTLPRLSWLLALLFGVFGVAMDARASSDPWSLTGLGFYAWIVAPFVLFALTASFGRLVVLTWGSLILLILAGAYGSLAYADVSFHIWSKSDAQEGLVFLVVPFAQLLFGIPTLGLLAALGAWFQHRNRKGADRSAP